MEDGQLADGMHTYEECEWVFSLISLIYERMMANVSQTKSASVP
jgi:hypothetical protein